MSADAALSGAVRPARAGQPRCWSVLPCFVAAGSATTGGTMSGTAGRWFMICLGFTMDKERGLDPIECLWSWWRVGGGSLGRRTRRVAQRSSLGLSGPSTAGDQRLARTTSDVKVRQGCNCGGTETGQRATAQNSRLELSEWARRQRPPTVRESGSWPETPESQNTTTARENMACLRVVACGERTRRLAAELFTKRSRRFQNCFKTCRR